MRRLRGGGVVSNPGGRVARRILVAAGAATVLVAVVWFVVYEPSLSHTIWGWLGTALVACGSLAGLVADLLDIGTRSSGRPRREDLVHSNLLEDEAFVDRREELATLVELLASSSHVNCVGSRGLGKSYLLAYFADLVNHKRQPRAEDPNVSLLRASAALYIDLAAAMGRDDVARQACERVNLEPQAGWRAFIDRIDQVFGRKRVLLILDNVNEPGIWEWLGSSCHEYRAKRPQDRIVFGSTERVGMQALTVTALRVVAFDEEAVRELVSASGPGTFRDGEALYTQSDGNPLYLRFLMANDASPDPSSLPALSSYLERTVMPNVTPDVRRVLAYAALLALSTRSVPVADLQRWFGESVSRQLDKAERHSLISRRVDADVAIHDLVREEVLRLLEPEVRAAAAELMRDANAGGRPTQAAVFACFADPASLDRQSLDELWHSVIVNAVRERDFSLLETIGHAARNQELVWRYIQEVAHRHDLFQFGHAAELAGIGEYEGARRVLEKTTVSGLRRASLEPSELQLDLHFLHADVAHLLNEYDDAIEMFEELRHWANGVGDRSHEAMALWGIGHCLRHQGADLGRALEMFTQAQSIAEECGETTVIVGSITGTTGIRVYCDSVPLDEEITLTRLEERVVLDDDSGHRLLEIWKSQAQVAWHSGRAADAREIIDSALSKALALNDRLIHNLRFEKAEFSRLGGRPREALSDYLRVHEAGERNHDRNLVSNALLGILCSELAAGEWIHHGSGTSARVAALRAYDIAQSADIRETARAAKQVVSAVDGGDSVQTLRLMLF
jgi:tetratricopeptide (TPR) repeat protein